MNETIGEFPLDYEYLAIFVVLCLVAVISTLLLRGKIREGYKTREAMRRSGLYLLGGGVLWLAVVSLILLYLQPNADTAYLIQFLLWKDLGIDRAFPYSRAIGFTFLVLGILVVLINTEGGWKKHS